MNSTSLSMAEELNTASVNFLIVGIGASAGGLEAFEQFFRHFPPDSRMAFVLVPHLDPSHHSILTEILQRVTTMPVLEAVDQIQVEVNHVYVIPPNREMEIFHGKLQLNLPEEPRGQRMPINTFFLSLAVDQLEKAIGIILSGTGTDGTLGLKAIMQAGGVTLVQDPASAKYSGMPLSAIEAGCATHVVPPDKMPETLLSMPSTSEGPGERPLLSKSENELNSILMQLRTTSGHDFSLYKKSTIGRRIIRRMSQHNIEDAKIYARYLKENPAEARALFKELLINVTNFFRDADAFVVLQKDILPLLCEGKPDEYEFRVWVAGCASGEEAYSIAILLREWMDENHRKLKVQIYSTDLDDEAIATARAGIYAPAVVKDISPERIERFFVKEDAGYRIKKDIREMVVFAVQDLNKDPPFTKLDLLSCRNLLIYLQPELQNRLIPVFHYALKPGGVLFLSPSESIGNHTELFSSINRKWKFYRATNTATSTHLMMAIPRQWAIGRGSTATEGIMQKTRETNFAELTRRVLLQCFAPASVVTDLKGDILYVHGETGNYLRPAPGQASLNIIEMSREGLKLQLRAAIHVAASEGVPTLNQEVQFKNNGSFAAVSLSVRLLPDPQGGQGHLLISFQEIATPPARSKGKRSARPAEARSIQLLEDELAYTKENLKTNIEEQQAFNEELKSSNEELQSTNEELQSTNEELETSKEELQSVNEELITVNSELQAKIEQLASMQNDMKNLLDNINIGTIFLDDHMVIRRFTIEATKIYRLVPSDVGRSLVDIKSDLKDEDLVSEAKAVLETLVSYEHEVCTHSGTWYLVRIQPYRTLDNVIQGVVMAFTDISQRIKAEAAVQAARELAESIVDTIREPLLVLGADLQVVSANRAFANYFKVQITDTIGRKIYDLGNKQWNIPDLRKLLEKIMSSGKVFEGYEVEHDFPTIGHRKLLLNARRIVGNSEQPPLILMALEESA